MPGLVGIVPKRYDPEGQLLERMIKAVAHRGFHRIDRYSSRFFHVGRVHLGIFNPEPQPIFNEDHSVCIFMDGKIYDYEEKMNILKLERHKVVDFEPEHCLHSYEELGKNFVTKLNGCFVIVIGDLERKRLLIANDRYGFRPLYCSYNDSRLLFSSEIKAILQDDQFKREINNEAVANFFAFGQLLGDQTFFKGVKVLPPASILICEPGKLSMEQYWNCEYAENHTISEVDLVDQLVRAFRKAVSKRISADNRYGVPLSGGLDSRSIVGAIDASRRGIVAAYTYGPPGNNEEKVAKVVAERAGINHKVIHFVNPELFVSYAKDVVYLTDGMDYITVSYIPYVYDKIRRYMDVVLISPMGSYVFGGDFLDSQTLKAKSEGELLAILYKKMTQRGMGGIMAKLFAKEYYGKIRDMPMDSLKKCLKKTSAKHPGNRTDQFLVQNVVRRFNILGHVLRRNYVEDTLPFYDNDFFDIVLKTPPELRMNHRIYMRFLRMLSPELVTIRYQRTMLPACAPLVLWKLAVLLQTGEVLVKRMIWRLSRGKIYLPSKRSYLDPDELFRINEKWKRYVKRILIDENRLSKAYFNEDYLRTIIQEHESGKADHSQTIGYVVTFELFLRLFLGHSDYRA